MRRPALFLALAAGVLFTGCQGSEGIDVTEARVGAPTGPNAALYFTASNDDSEPDVLIGVSTEVAGTAELHETTHGDDGTMGMRPVSSLDLPAGETLTLEPGGLHVMLIDVSPLEEGDRISVTLHWQSAGEMGVDAEVVSPADTMAGHDDG